MSEGKSKVTGGGGSFGVALTPFGRYGFGDGWTIVPAWRFRAPKRAANDNRAPILRRVKRLLLLTLLAAACVGALFY